jgi:type IV pilus assembly protein PilC
VRIRESVLEFTEIMTVLLEAGNTAETALAMAGEIASPGVRPLCRCLHEHIVQGTAFYESLRLQREAFSPLYCELVRIGEETGAIADVFKRLQEYLTTQKNFRDKLTGALAYPVIVLVTAFSGAIALLIFVLPRMAEIFSVLAAGNEELVADHVSSMYRTVYGLLIVLSLIIAVIGGGIVLRARLSGARLFIDRILLMLPAVGTFIIARESLDVFFAMELCTRSGMSAAEALGRSAGLARNASYRNALFRVEESVRRGDTLEFAFEAEPVFPPYISTWLAVGEKTGAGETVFTHLRSFFQSQTEKTQGGIAALLEPLLILAAGAVLLVLILNLVAPLYSLYGAGL